MKSAIQSKRVTPQPSRRRRTARTVPASGGLRLSPVGLVIAPHATRSRPSDSERRRVRKAQRAARRINRR